MTSGPGCAAVLAVQVRWHAVLAPSPDASDGSVGRISLRLVAGARGQAHLAVAGAAVPQAHPFVVHGGAVGQAAARGQGGGERDGWRSGLKIGWCTMQAGWPSQGRGWQSQALSCGTLSTDAVPVHLLTGTRPGRDPGRHQTRWGTLAPPPAAEGSVRASGEEGSLRSYQSLPATAPWLPATAAAGSHPGCNM